MTEDLGVLKLFGTCGPLGECPLMRCVLRGPAACGATAVGGVASFPAQVREDVCCCGPTLHADEHGSSASAVVADPSPCRSERRAAVWAGGRQARRLRYALDRAT